MDLMNDRAQHWRERASELRVMAVSMRDPLATRVTLDVAKSYDRMADRAEERLGKNSSQ
jgi:hypothetical protein